MDKATSQQWPAEAAGRVLSFFVAGEPVPKGRPRLGRKGTFTDPRTEAWESTVRWQCRAACTAAGWSPLAAACEVTLVVHRARRAGDVDNFAKAVLDGMNRIAFADDRHVVRLDVSVDDSRADDPGVWVRVTERVRECPLPGRGGT